MLKKILNSSFSHVIARNPSLTILPRAYIRSSASKVEISKLYDRVSQGEVDGKIMDYQNGVIFFKTPKDVPLAYKSVIETQDGAQAVVLSLDDHVSGAVLLEDTRAEVGDQLQFKLVQQQGVFTTFDPLNFGKIVDYLGRPIDAEAGKADGPKCNIFGPAEKQERLKINSQLFTGNIAVDFTKPLAKGNFVFFQGDANRGKTHLAAQTAINFLRSDYFDQSGKPKKVIYVNVNINEAKAIYKDFQEAGCHEDFIAFSASSKLEANFYFTPFAALTYANLLKSQGNDVLLIFDDMVEHYVKEMLIFQTMNQPFAPLNIVNEIYMSTGVFEKGSLSTIMIFDTNQVNPEVQTAMTTYQTHIESLCDVKIDFDFRDPLFKTVLPKVDTTVDRNRHYWMPPVMKVLSRALNSLLNDIKIEKENINLKKELKLQVDPWECYLLLDSTYFMRLLISSRKMTVIEELIMVGFVIRAVEQDSISYFKDEPRVLVQELFKFIKELPEFEKTDLVTYIHRLITRDGDSEETAYTIIESINRMYELFFMHCRIQSRLLPYKKDYFT